MSIFRSRNSNKIFRARKKLDDTFPNDLQDLPEIVENIIWHLDGRSILRAKQVSHSWKEIVERLEQYYQLWRHLCLRDIHRASLIDIIGFNPLSDDYQQKDYVNDDADFEDLWKNVYRTWRTSQTLSPYKQISYKLTGVEYLNPLIQVLQIGTYVYILRRHDTMLSVWNIDTGHRVVYSQELKGITYPCRPSPMFSYLQNPLCKFSKHQELTQHSLILPTNDYSVQWWVFSDEEFRVATVLNLGYKHVMGVWHNLLVIASADCIKVYILERKENEYNFRLRNMTKELTKDLLISRSSVIVWDRKCVFPLRYSNQLSIVIYDLDDLQPQVFQVSHGPSKTTNQKHMTDIRIFGDCILFTIDEELYVFNTKTGEQVMLKIEGAKGVARYTLCGDLLVMHHYRPFKEYIRRINSSAQKDPIWFTCTDEICGSFQAGLFDFHRSTLVLPAFESQLCSTSTDGYNMISYGKGGVLLIGKLSQKINYYVN
ncbi:uncharacterized protein LOC117102656 isoform X2 [Anneissia japonica]|uniref:uncharacterized protein LOC117102656 isoform X1 n=1 Tax=Anneissia japonica TaxID=1529436 RepID=UPI0014255E25|nr:uncharacterized protein LOC117102656 isoform X1 [Anneissia japonica]XP_033098914.1 uncharacterized protein LOC117102656 isoform X2 [Anneissia japonica]